jgi:hypothetical protein
MTSYFIAGKADDPSFARAEYVAKQIEVSYPNIFFHYEMKHPDDWKEFINSVFRKYDFDEYPEDYPGPLIWTHEGHLVGGSAEFVQKVCIEKFGMKNPPTVTDPMFKAIAGDNFKMVKAAQHRLKHGPNFSEKCDTRHAEANAAGLLTPLSGLEQKTAVRIGVPLEVWTSPDISAKYEAMREKYGDGQSAHLDERMCIGAVGQELSHQCVLHPEPIVPKHMALVPQRMVKPPKAPEGDEEAAKALAGLVEIPPMPYGKVSEEDLGVEDFIAAAEVLTSVGGVAVWSGIEGGCAGYRHPLDTHLTVLPFPIRGNESTSPLRHPLELHAELALKDNLSELKVFPFQHRFMAINADNEKPKASDLGKEMLAAYEKAKQDASSCLLAFTSTWLLLVPLSPPTEATGFKHELWLKMPPPPPYALIGVVICPTVEKEWPEIVGLEAPGKQLIANRAETEGIPKDSKTYAEAERQVRIVASLTEKPVDVLALWAISA